MPRLHHYKAKQVAVNRKRHYEIGGQTLPGITTILSDTKPKAARDRLRAWQERIGKDEAQRITTHASRCGTKLHKALRQQLNQETPDITEAIAGYWTSIQPVIDGIEETLLVEGAIWHPKGFAGYPDALIVLEGQLCLCDWKTAIRPKRAEDIEDYFMQIAAYVHGVNWVYQDETIMAERGQVTQGMVAIALDNQPAQTFRLGPAELAQYWEQFKKRTRQYYYRRRLKPPGYEMDEAETS